MVYSPLAKLLAALSLPVSSYSGREKKKTGKRDSLIYSSISNLNNVCNSVQKAIFLRRDTNNVTLMSGSPLVSKKRCCSSATSPVWFSYSPSRSLIDQLKALFPDMDSELFEKVLEESGNNLDATIKSLLGLHVGYAEGAEDNWRGKR
ncbi:unnamed protein product [Fraxinus pennsylvanica]|uniref:CUE domain-containing protein n=1 Tax=Fraxinus pennsylvanica TaxID=56036 RepID=A0AAD2DUU3_9LAMI|nr:unnamed protein product [Fraxinus pennsylvanica]